MPVFTGTKIGDVYYPWLLPFVGLPGQPPTLQPGAIIDSGADWTVVSLVIVQTLLPDAEWEDLEAVPTPTMGVSGPEEMRRVDITLAWPEPKDVFCTSPRVVRTDMPVLLGRDDFFRRWSVRLNWQHTPPYPPWFEIQPVSMAPLRQPARKRPSRQPAGKRPRRRD